MFVVRRFFFFVCFSCVFGAVVVVEFVGVVGVAGAAAIAVAFTVAVVFAVAVVCCCCSCGCGSRHSHVTLNMISLCPDVWQVFGGSLQA